MESRVEKRREAQQLVAAVSGIAPSASAVTGAYDQAFSQWSEYLSPASAATYVTAANILGNAASAR